MKACEGTDVLFLDDSGGGLGQFVSASGFPCGGRCAYVLSNCAHCKVLVVQCDPLVAEEPAKVFV